MPTGVYDRSHIIPKKRTAETIEKWRKSILNGKHIPWNKGKKGLQVSWSKGLKGKDAPAFGDKNGMWKGGISKNNYQGRKEQVAGRARPQRCEVCYEQCNPDYDHCHKTGKFRGWLCRRCNLILGMAKDNNILLRNLALYLDISYDETRPERLLDALLHKDNGSQ